MKLKYQKCCGIYTTMEEIQRLREIGVLERINYLRTSHPGTREQKFYQDCEE